DTTVIEAYFPDARWYSYYDGTEITARGQTISLSAPLTFINLHIRGGYVIPTQEPAVNTERSRLNPMGMIVALDDNEAATGLLFYDDGDSIDPVNNGNYFLASIQVSSSQLEFIVENNTYEEMASLTMGQIRIMGVKATPSTVQVNGANIDFTVLQSGVSIPDPLTNPEYRVDCQPEGVADATICLERGCVYDEIYDAPGTPWCFFPVDYGYRLTGTPNVNDKGIVFNLVRNSVPSLFGNEWQSITLEVQYQTDDRLRVKAATEFFEEWLLSLNTKKTKYIIFKHGNDPVYDSKINTADQEKIERISDGQPRWEVPIAIDNPSEVPANPLYEVSHTAGSTFSFQVVRKSTGTVIFDSSLGGLTLSDQFLQISTLLSMDAIFGFGENEQPSLRHDMNWKTWALWARDQAPSSKEIEGSAKKTWQVIKSIAGDPKNGKSCAIKDAKDKILVDPGKSSELFCEYFANIGSHLSWNIRPPEHINFERFLPAFIDDSPYLRPTNCTKLDNIVRSMKPSSAGGDELNLKGAANMYGTQPYYTGLEPNGDAHGVLILNSNAQEVTMTPAPGMVYRTIGGILDLYFFLGPNPEAVAGQFSAAVGRSFIPPYWALGFQICRWGYENTSAIRAVVDRTAAAEIPHDVQYGDIDIMDRALDFTISPINFPDLPDYVKEIKSRGLKFATILDVRYLASRQSKFTFGTFFPLLHKNLSSFFTEASSVGGDPGISTGEPEGTYPAYDEGNRLDVWMKRPDGTPSTGFTNLPLTNLQDMNEPANFVNGDVNGCSENTINFPPYKP
ncbi:hypothetical protein QYM36_005675, partial [Artemia franciscana]